MEDYGEDIPLVTAEENTVAEERVYIIEWHGTPEDYAKYNTVITEFSMEKMKRMLLGGAPYLHKVDASNYPMRNSAFYSRTDIMEIILERHKTEGTHDDKKKFRNQTCEALTAVCKNNCGDIARILLQVDTPVIPNVHLNQAAKNGSTAVLDEIITFIPDIAINSMDREGNTPLHKAVERKHPHTVLYLLNHNANPNLANYIGYNSVHMACQYADEDIIYLLTTRGGDVNAREHKGKTPVMIAAENGKDGYIHILAAAGASLDQRDKQGNAPLIVAASQGFTHTARELILNGASFDVTDNERYNALERAITNKKDGAAAIIIRLSPRDEFFKYYLKELDIKWLKIIRYRLTKTLKALLDRMVVQNDPPYSIQATVLTKYLEVDIDGNTPAKNGYQKNKTYLLQRIARLDDEDIAYHGTIRILVDNKMERFGYWILYIKISFHVIFLLSLAYSLTFAAYEPIQLNIYQTKDTLSIFRNLAELFVLVYFIIDFVSELVEIIQVAKLTFTYLNDKKQWKKYDKASKPEANSDTNKKKRSLNSLVNNQKLTRVLTDYLSDEFNYLDVLGLLTLFILIILRVTTQPTQWIFATLTFLINCLRSFKLIALIPGIGPYTNVIYKILVKDVPLFSTLFLLTLLIFTGGYFVSLRTPYSPPGFVNASLNQDTERISGVDNELQWVFLSGLRILLEGNVYEGQYLFRQINWLAASIYLGFLFLTVVVYLNVFIAQLSDTYGTVRKNAERTYAWQRLNFIVQVETTSLMSLGLDYRKDYFIEKICMDKESLYKYYAVNNIKWLNINSFTNEIAANSALVSIQSQQKVMRREIVNINKAEESTVQQIQSQTQEIKELKDRIDKLVTDMDTVMEDRQEKSTQAILRMIEEKFNELK